MPSLKQGDAFNLSMKLHSEDNGLAKVVKANIYDSLGAQIGSENTLVQIGGTRIWEKVAAETMPGQPFSIVDYEVYESDGTTIALDHLSGIKNERFDREDDVLAAITPTPGLDAIGIVEEDTEIIGTASSDDVSGSIDEEEIVGEADEDELTGTIDEDEIVGTVEDD